MMIATDFEHELWKNSEAGRGTEGDDDETVEDCVRPATSSTVARANINWEPTKLNSFLFYW